SRNVFVLRIRNSLKMIPHGYFASAVEQAKFELRGPIRKCAVLVYLAITVLSLGRYSRGAEAPDKISPLRLRGFMVDPPRTPESLDYYRRLIAFSADWGFNALVFRI